MSDLTTQKRGASRFQRLGVFAVLIALTINLPGYGQVSPEEHAKHHPGQGTDKSKDGPPGKATGDEGAETGGGMDGMGKMMEGARKAPPKDLYPTLMSLPDLAPEQREQVRSQAQERMHSGVALLSTGLERLARAAETEDYAAMQDAAAQVREALARFETGLAAQRALADGKQPRQVALQWFKEEMSLQPPQGVEASSASSGLSIFHFFTMVLLIAFALAMLAMYYFKMRRAADLFGRIEASEGAPPPGSAPELAGAEPPPASSADKPAADAQGTSI